jgi:archaellum component FlaC
MTIAQALKEKNKKVALIQKLWQRIQAYNSLSEGSERPYDIEATYAQVKKEIDSLITLKANIHTASEPVRKEIFELSELKSAIQNVRAINTTKGQYRDRYSETSVNRTAVLGVDWQDSQIESLEARIESIQEKLDKFNHSTQI